MVNTNKTRNLILFALLFVLLASVTLPLVVSKNAYAVTGSDWKPGRIIDDAVFNNKNSMNPQQIQQFLDAKVPVCDRNRPSSNPTYQPPWTCLKEYQENTTTKENNVGRFNANGTPYQVPGGKLASQIIWEVGQEYGLNPQVLIVMLQKEQSLITDNWPWKVQYDKAMGYACPDTAPCNELYYGFYNQVSSAAWQLKRYIQYPNNYNFKAGVTRYIQYSPNTSCGGSNVFLENAPTAALYNYTPYQPNAGALANLYGSANCGAYGNRNFWRFFNDWFGSTTVPNANIKISSVITASDTQPNMGDRTTITYQVKNVGYTTTDTGVLWICGSINGKAFGGGSNRKVLAPGESLTISMPYTATETGTLTVTACGDVPGGTGWTANYPYGEYSDHRTRSFTVSPSAVVIAKYIGPYGDAIKRGEVNNISYVVRNRDTKSRDTGVLWICGSINGKAFGGGSNKKVLAPGESLTISMPYTATETGTLTVTACGDVPGGTGWTANYPYKDFPDHGTRNYKISSSPLYISYAVSHSSLKIISKQQTTLYYQVKNPGKLPLDTGVLWICGSINGKAFGGGSNRKVLAPGESLTISMPYTATETGTLTVTACGDVPGGTGWTANYPYGEYSDHRTRSFTVSL